MTSHKTGTREEWLAARNERMRAAAGGSGAGALCCQDGSPPQRPLPGIRRLTAGIDLDGRTRDALLRTWLRLPHDFRMEPRVRREDREILLLSRMLTLNEQEAAWALASAD